jgi:hypothetical protein
MGSERPNTPRERLWRLASRVLAKRQVGAAAISVLVYLLLIGGATCVLLGMLVLLSNLLIWRGLDFPLDARRGFGLIAAGAALAAIGLLAWRYARRFI